MAVCKRVRVTMGDYVQAEVYLNEVRREAHAKGVNGWVRQVGEVVHAAFEGDPAVVDHMVDWCRQGPPRTTVKHLDLWENEPVTGETGFRIRR